MKRLVVPLACFQSLFLLLLFFVCFGFVVFVFFLSTLCTYLHRTTLSDCTFLNGVGVGGCIYFTCLNVLGLLILW